MVQNHSSFRAEGNQSKERKSEKVVVDNQDGLYLFLNPLAQWPNRANPTVPPIWDTGPQLP